MRVERVLVDAFIHDMSVRDLQLWGARILAPLRSPC
jgi:hypothetical protein